jgi:DNA-binding CsgD family transcriptional regulator
MTDVRDGNAVLVFDIDALGVEHEAASARCDVRLVDLARPRNGAQEPRRDPSAVVVLRALTRARLATCVRAVARDGGSMSPESLCRMLASPPESETQLTRRELDVLRRLADGDSTRDIADRLNYSERTVKNIVRDLLVKLNGRTRAHAVALAARQGLI